MQVNQIDDSITCLCLIMKPRFQFFPPQNKKTQQRQPDLLLLRNTIQHLGLLYP